MKKLSGSGLLRWLAVVAVVFYPLGAWPARVEASPYPPGGGSATSFVHKAPDHFVPGRRIELTASIKDPSWIEEARCYFRAHGEEEFVFVEMTGLKNKYRAVLPAPAEETSRIDYFFLAKNRAGAVTRTQDFYLFQDPRAGVPKWQQVVSAAVLKVGTEGEQVPERLAGFSDNVELAAVSPGARLEKSEGMATVWADSRGKILGVDRTAALIGGGALVAGGTVAAIAAGSGGGGGSSDPKYFDPVGNWTLRGHWHRINYSFTGTWIINSDKTVVAPGVATYGTVTWAQSGNNVTVTFPYGRTGATRYGTTYRGTMTSNDYMEGTMQSWRGDTGTWSARRNK